MDQDTPSACGMGMSATMNESITGAGAPNTLPPGGSCHQSVPKNRLVTEEEFGRSCIVFERFQTSTWVPSYDQPRRRSGDCTDFQISARIPLPTRCFLAYARAGHLPPGGRNWRKSLDFFSNNASGRLRRVPLFLQLQLHFPILYAIISCARIPTRKGRRYEQR